MLIDANINHFVFLNASKCAYYAGINKEKRKEKKENNIFKCKTIYTTNLSPW